MGVAEVSSTYFGDVGSSSLRNAKGLASGRDPGRPLLAWRRVALFRKGASRNKQCHGMLMRVRLRTTFTSTAILTVALPSLKRFRRSKHIR
ncbi:hypothetical protein SVAN01_10072 [Stagonosporopsis vannaccii]|nr:hypothetical protein SVAN01_10072 [Stagonosporopsis vannaccii]